MLAKITEFQNRIDKMAPIEFEELVCAVYGEMFKRHKGFHISHSGKQFGKLNPVQHPVDIEISFIDEYDLLHHVLIAVSNQKSNLYSVKGKLRQDCFSIFEYIKKNDIHNVEIIAVYSKNPSENITPDILSLKTELKDQGINLSLVNAETLNIYINEYCPYIYRDYLGLNIYSGGIVNLTDHINKKLGDYYKYELLGRETELKELQDILINKRCLLIRGHSGCGKTRLAIELANTVFESNYKCLWVESLNLPSINDFDNFYEKDIKMIVIIDDLNKLAFLNTFLQKIMLYENTYVIMTIRDYLYEEYRQIIDIKYFEYHLKELEPSKIKDIIRQIFKVNDKFLDYILLVTRNNLRFAIMATNVLVIEKKAPPSIDEIFDAYYRELIKKTGIEDNDELKRTIVALSFFDSIDLRSKENNKQICSIFGIKENDFIEMCNIAHEKEIADFYFDRMFIKISDQIFAEYLFYKYVFVFNKIDVFDLFKAYHNSRKQRFIQIIKAIVNVYFTDDSFYRQLQEFKQKVIDSDNQGLIISFFTIFSQLFVEDSITYSHQELEKRETPIDGDYVQLLTSQNYLDLIDILLSNYDSKEYSRVIDCVLALIKKTCLKDTIIKKIISNCSIKNDNYENGLKFYNRLMEEIYKLAKNNDDYLSMLFEIVKKVYPYEYDYNEYRDSRSITFCRMVLPLNDLYKETRAIMWKSIGLLHNKSYDQKKINELVKDNFAMGDISKHRKYDSEQALIIVGELDLTNYENIVFAYSILNQFSRFENVKKVIESLAKDPETNLLYDFVISKTLKRYDGSFENALINKCFKNYSSSEELVGVLSELYRKYSSYDTWKINEIIAYGFEYAFLLNKPSYDSNLLSFLRINPDYNGNPSLLVKRLNSKRGFLDWAKLSSLQYKLNFIGATLYCLDVEEIDDSLYEYALEFFSNDYMNAETFWGNENITSTMNFENYKNGFIFNLLRKIEVNIASSHFVEYIFFGQDSVEKVFALINHDLELLKKIYFGLLTSSRFYDHDGSVTSFLLEKDSSCLKKIILLIIEGKTDIDRFGTLYHYPNFVDVFNDIIVTTQISYSNFAISHCMEKMPDDVFVKLMDTFIEQHKASKNYMQHFSMLVERRNISSQIAFVDSLIKQSVPIEIFRSLNLFEGPMSWTGSRIPYLQNYINSINDYLSSSNAPSDYRIVLESIVNRLEKSIRYEEIEEFNRGY